jgi:chromosome segregation ATPase
MSELEDILGEMHADLELSSQETREQQEKNNKLVEENDNLDKEIAAKREKNNTLVEDIDKLDTEIAAKRQKRLSIDKTIPVLKGVATKFQAQIDALIKEEVALKARMPKQNEELREFKSLIDDIDTLKNLKNDAERLRQKNDKLQNKQNMLNQELVNFRDLFGVESYDDLKSLEHIKQILQLDNKLNQSD